MFDLTPAHLHLLVNHLPVEGSIFAFLLLIYAMARRSAELKRLALLAFILVGICAFVADYTGGGASREMRNVAGVDRALIKEHSAAADWAQMIAFGVAVVSLVGFILALKKPNTTLISTDTDEYFRHHKEPPQWIILVCLIAGLLEVSVFAMTAYRGGLIRHPEIQSSFQLPTPAADTTRR
jgi:hypothetical protein